MPAPIQAQIDKRELAKRLAPLYRKDILISKDYVSIAKLCDDILDPTGNLLGFVRDEAAEVGDKMGPWDDRYSGSAKEIEAHTIERCAQVADQCEPHTYPGRVVALKIAAAIRALKD